MNTYLTTREISEDLNISVATLHRYRVRGTGPEFYQLPGGTYRYPRDRYEAWKREQFALRSFA